ncbi:hypothetical protein QQS21_012848, partial [Conoideocrella luteorostrata]
MAPRSAFTWPGPLDLGSSTNSIMGADMNSLVSGSEPSLTPTSEARSLASSPPRGSLTPEQNEMKRHRDKARRESKLTTRMRRAESTSYTTSPPPMSLSDPSNAIPLPLYSTAPSASILTEPSPHMPTHQYMPSYSPSLQEAPHNSQMFTSAPFQQSIPPSYSMSMDYPTLYSGPSDYSARASSQPISQENGLLYPAHAVSAISSTSNTRDSGH